MVLECETLYNLLSAKFPTANIDWIDHVDIPKPPYVLYLESSPKNIAADNKVHISLPHYVVELYLKRTDYTSEAALEKIFDDNDIYWKKDKIWNRELKLCQVNYTI